MTTRFRRREFDMGDVGLALASIVIRVILGIFLAAVFSFVGWMVAWGALHSVTFNWGVFLLITLPSVGGLVGLSAVLAWWNPASPRSVTILSAVLTIAGAMVSSWIAYRLASANPYYTWLGRRIVFPMQRAAIIGANVVAGGMYAFRALVRREV